MYWFQLGYGTVNCLLYYQAKTLPTFKDNDFLTDGAKIIVGEEMKKDLMDRLAKDVEVRLTQGIKAERF